MRLSLFLIVFRCLPDRNSGKSETNQRNGRHSHSNVSDCRKFALFPGRILCRKSHKGPHIGLAINHIIGEDNRDGIDRAVVGADSAIPAFILVLHHWRLLGRDPVDDIPRTKIIANGASFLTNLGIDHNGHFLHTSYENSTLWGGLGFKPVGREMARSSSPTCSTMMMRTSFLLSVSG
jgi:hypothetical protein